MILEKLPEAKELTSVNDLYWELIKRYSHTGLNDERFNQNYIVPNCPINKFMSDFSRIIKSGHIKDLDGPTTNTALEELVDMEKEISKIEADVKLYTKMGLMK